MMAGFSSGLEGECGVAKLKMQTLWQVINEVWEALGHMAEKEAVIYRRPAETEARGGPCVGLPDC